MNIAALTVDDMIKLRVALINFEVTLNRLIKQDKDWAILYKGQLDQVKEAKQALSDSLNRG